MFKYYKIRLLKSKIIFLFLFSLTISFLFVACVYKKPKGSETPIGYNIEKPIKYNMHEILLEISGIAFNKGNNDFIYAEQDEDGSLYRLPLGSKEYISTKFAKKGDYEDVAILKDLALILKSNGEFFTFPLTEINNEDANNVTTTKGILPKGEYEGMFADEPSGQIYVLCKDCKVDKGSKNSTGYILTLQQDGTLKLAGNFNVDISGIDKIIGKKKGSFRPSALAINPLTKEWFIISSVNKALVVTDSNFKVKDAFHLSSNIFNQPEGIAFDKEGNLYISNEGSETQAGNILRFDYKKP